MSKIPDKKNLKENSFEGSPGGAGSLNYGQSYGTFASPQASQNPNDFQSSNSNKDIGANSNTAKEAPDSGSIGRDLNAIFSKKNTPTPDDVAAGLKYELGHMNKKDKFKAKELVLKNLKQDPKFYTSLKMLNIDDEHMMDNMTEQKQHPNDKPKTTKVTPNINETKKIFTELLKEKDSKYVVNSGISEVMKEMWQNKQNRSAWKSGK